MSYNVYVLGNGKSRETVDLNKLDGIVIGCNAIHREYTPDILCCADERMVVEAKANNFPNDIYTRSKWHAGHGVKAFPDLPYEGDKKFDDPWHWNTGPHAINLACTLDSMHTTIHLYGFDFVQNTLYENMYAGTKNYDYKTIDPTHWYYQLGMLYRSHRDLDFVWHAPKHFTCPQEWFDLYNFTHSVIL